MSQAIRLATTAPWSQFLPNRPLVGKPSADNANLAPHNFCGLSKVSASAGRFSDHKKGISSFLRRFAAVFRPAAPAASPSRKEGSSGAGDCGNVAEKNPAANPGTMPPREARFRKTLVVDRG